MAHKVEFSALIPDSVGEISREEQENLESGLRDAIVRVLHLSDHPEKAELKVSKTSAKTEKDTSRIITGEARPFAGVAIPDDVRKRKTAGADLGVDDTPPAPTEGAVVAVGNDIVPPNGEAATQPAFTKTEPDGGFLVAPDATRDGKDDKGDKDKDAKKEEGQHKPDPAKADAQKAHITQETEAQKRA